MKVKVLWGFAGQEGLVSHGDELDVSEQRAKVLISKGLVEEVKEKAAKAPKENKKAKPKANKAK